jgi:hypothetical protein
MEVCCVELDCVTTATDLKLTGEALPQKSKSSYLAVGFSLMPQRGYGLQPRVAASATLGTSEKRKFNRNAVASLS